MWTPLSMTYEIWSNRLVVSLTCNNSHLFSTLNSIVRDYYDNKRFTKFGYEGLRSSKAGVENLRPLTQNS